MPATHQTIYSACRTVVSIAKRGDGLYNVLQMELERYVNVLVKECTRKGRGPVEWIGLFVSTCTSFETRVVSPFNSSHGSSLKLAVQDLLVSLLAYLDQDYIVKNSPLKPIRSTANTILRELVFGNPTVLENIYEGTKDWIESERNSKYVFCLSLVSSTLSLAEPFISFVPESLVLSICSLVTVNTRNLSDIMSRSPMITTLRSPSDFQKSSRRIPGLSLSMYKPGSSRR